MISFVAKHDRHRRPTDAVFCSTVCLVGWLLFYPRGEAVEDVPSCYENAKRLKKEVDYLMDRYLGGTIRYHNACGLAYLC